MVTLDEYRKSIAEDIEEGTQVEIIEDAGSSIKVLDETESYRELMITDPSLITVQWLRDRLIVTPRARELSHVVDEDALCTWLAKNVDPDMMVTLRAIVILGDDYDEDYEYLKTVGDFAYELEASDLPIDELGLHWFSYGKVFAHMGNIIEGVREMADTGDIYPWEDRREVGYGLLTTLVHEIRHLAQANPYLPESVLCQGSDDETDAESYARDVVNAAFADVVRS